MKKKIIALSTVILSVAMFVATFGLNAKDFKVDTTDIDVNVMYAGETTATTNAIGSLIENVAGGNVIGDALGSAGQNIGSALEGVTGNLGDAAGNIGDALGGIGNSNGNGLSGVVGGIGDTIDNISGIVGSFTTTKPATTELDTITPVPAASQLDTQVANPIITQNTTPSTTAVADGEGETVDFSATSNPYKKPTIELKAGDKDNSVKWVQWIFIYTHYGLNENGITGVLDDDTVHYIKKFQAQRGITVDGNMSKEFVDNLELYFYEYTFGTSSTTAVPLTQPTQMETVEADTSGDNESNMKLLIIALIMIWVLAIVVIVALVIFLKKKGSLNNKKNSSAVVSSSETKQTTGEGDNSDNKPSKSLADLFEDSDNK